MTDERPDGVPAEGGQGDQVDDTDLEGVHGGYGHNGGQQSPEPCAPDGPVPL